MINELGNTGLFKHIISLQKKNVFYLLLLIANILGAQTISVNNSEICEGSSFNLFIDNYSDQVYNSQWQRSINQVEWSDLSDDSIYSGVINEILNISNVPYSLNNTYYRCLIDSTNDSNFDVTTSSFQLTLFTNTVAGLIDGNQAICYNTTPNLITTNTLPAGGDGNYTYQWFKSDDGNNWSQISGAVQKDYQPSSLTKSTFYRVEYFGLCNSLYSNIAEIEVYDELTAGEIVGDIICYNTIPGLLTFSTLPTGADGNYTYQWQESDDLTIWNDIIGATSISYQDTALTQTKYYRNIVSSTFGCDNVTTNIVSVNVYPEFITGIINDIDPVCYNEIPNLITTTKLPTGGDGSYTYQWQMSSDQSIWNEISGATNKDYQPSNLTSTTYYRVEYTNLCEAAFSNTSEAVVNMLPDDVDILGEENVCANQKDVVYKISNLNEFYSYQWQCTNGEIVLGVDSTECVINWDNTPGETGAIYLEQTIVSTGCSTIITLPIQIGEYSMPNKTSIIRKPSSNILIGKDESAGLIYQWGYDIIGSNNSVTIDGANLRYVQMSNDLDFNKYRYWLRTSFEYQAFNGCQVYTYYDPYGARPNIGGSSVEDVLMYPIPSNGTIYFDNLNLKQSGVKVYSINGRLIKCIIKNESTLILDKRTPPGIYYITMNKSGRVITKKIILN